VAQALLRGDQPQAFQRGVPAAEQPVQVGIAAEVEVACVHDLRTAVTQAQGTELAAAAQPLVVQRLALLDEARLEQQRTDFAGGAHVADGVRLAQHARFVGAAQVRQDAAAQVDALADIQRQAAAGALEDVDAGCGGQGLGLVAQVRRIVERRRFVRGAPRWSGNRGVARAGAVWGHAGSA
jgi:hypothetical protein